jgi:hypothetical protein
MPGSDRARDENIVFNRDNKFDLQLSASLIRERALGDVFVHAIFDGTRPVSIELKSETWQWEQTGNICVEYCQRGQPSGIAATKADVWVHELRRDGQTLCWLMFPIDRFRELAKQAYRQGRYHEGGGDGGQFCNVLIPLREILR